MYSTVLITFLLFNHEPDTLYSYMSYKNSVKIPILSMNYKSIFGQLYEIKYNKNINT